MRMRLPLLGFDAPVGGKEAGPYEHMASEVATVAATRH